MNTPRKHHYIPKFYLKYWANSDNKICEFSKPWGNTIVPKRVHPSGTGYKEGLYSFLFSDEPSKQLVEQNLFKKIDDNAAVALRHFHNSTSKENLDRKHVFDFSHFLNSLQLRCPEDIEKLREDWINKVYVVDPSQPETIEHTFPIPKVTLNTEEADLEHSMYSTLKTVMENSYQGFTGLNWRIATIRDSRFSLLTSDRPIVRTYALNHPHGTLFFPIGPNKLIIAWKDKFSTRLGDKRFHFRKPRENEIQLHGERIARFVNEMVTENAVKYVYAKNDSMRRFVQNRMSTRHYPRLSDDFAYYFGKNSTAVASEIQGVRLDDFIGVLKKS